MGRLQRPTGDDEKVAGRGRKAAHSRLKEIHDFLAKGLSPLVRNLLKRRAGEIVFRTTLVACATISGAQARQQNRLVGRLVG